jgi:hypothetical protein
LWFNFHPIDLGIHLLFNKLNSSFFAQCIKASLSPSIKKTKINYYLLRSSLILLALQEAFSSRWEVFFSVK